MILYHCTGSRGLRPLWLIEELGIDCDVKMLPFPPRRQQPEFLEINPLGTIPVLVDGDLTMTESIAITQYLCTLYGQTDLVVEAGEKDYGVFLDFLHHGDATLTFPLTVHLRFSVMEAARGLVTAGDLYRDWFLRRLVKVEEKLKGNAYLCGNRFTIADIVTIYPLHLASLLGLKDRLPPVVLDYLGAMSRRPAFRRALARETAQTS